VVDETRFVAADRGVDHNVVVDREEKCVMPLSIDVGITRVGLRWRQPLARILDETRTGGNATRRECAKSLDRRLANLEWVGGVGTTVHDRAQSGDGLTVT
jgi:hypothetical protein